MNEPETSAEFTLALAQANFYEGAALVNKGNVSERQREAIFMRINFRRLSLATTLIAALGLLAAFASSASADSITCEISGSIKLSPGLSETPTVQQVGITKHKGAALNGCTGVETKVTGGSVHVSAKTKEAVTCKVLKETGGAALESANDAQFKWLPSELEMSKGALNVPITEVSALLSGTMEMGTFPFSEDTITGTVKETYTGGSSCGVSSGHKKAKKVNKGQFSGTITIS